MSAPNWAVSAILNVYHIDVATGQELITANNYRDLLPPKIVELIDSGAAIIAAKAPKVEVECPWPGPFMAREHRPDRWQVNGPYSVICENVTEGTATYLAALLNAAHLDGGG